MTNTKFRRRALVSSVAMLLVALVALGSATFAWFTDNPVAKATGISGKGQTATGLVIYTDTDPTPADSHAAEFFKNVNTFTMVPAYDPLNHTFVKAPATVSTASGIKTGDTWSSVSTLAHVTGEGVYKESAYLKTTGQGTTNTPVYLTGIAINEGSGSMKNGVCVAVYVGNTHIATYKLGGTAPIDYGTVSDGDTTAAGNGSQTVKAFGATNGVSTSLGNANDSTALQVDFYVYLDGSDASVYTDNATADDLVSSIVANFSTVQPS